MTDEGVPSAFVGIGALVVLLLLDTRRRAGNALHACEALSMGL